LGETEHDALWVADALDLDMAPRESVCCASITPQLTAPSALR
jgi:hypothetical protein